jgi:hypothetical protein
MTALCKSSQSHPRQTAVAGWGARIRTAKWGIRRNPQAALRTGFSAPDRACGAGATTTGASNGRGTPTLASNDRRRWPLLQASRVAMPSTVTVDVKVGLPAKAITSRAKIIVRLGKAREPQLPISFLHRGSRTSATAKRRRRQSPRYLENHQEYPNAVTTVQADAFVPSEQRCRGEPRAVVAFAAGNAAPHCRDASRA